MTHARQAAEKIGNAMFDLTEVDPDSLDTRTIYELIEPIVQDAIDAATAELRGKIDELEVTLNDEEAAHMRDDEILQQRTRERDEARDAVRELKEQLEGAKHLTRDLL